MRNWLNAARSYMRPIEIGESMRAAGIGRVVDSKSKNIAVGDLVSRVLSYGLETMRRTLRDRFMGLLIGRNIGLGVMIKWNLESAFSPLDLCTSLGEVDQVPIVIDDSDI
jgi:hypothetical protein